MSRRRAGLGRVYLVIALLAVAAAVVAIVTLTRAATDTSIEAPGLWPEFSPSGHDYTVSCEEPVELRVRAGGEREARIGAGEWRAGEQERTLELKPGGAVVVKLRDGPGDRAERYFLRCLPPDFPRFEFTSYPGVKPGLWIVSPLNLENRPPFNYTFVFDHRGAPVWWMRTEPPSINAQMHADGTISWTTWGEDRFGTDPRIDYEFRTLDGELVRRVKTVGWDTPADHHEMVETPRGTYFLVSYRLREGVDLRPVIDDPDAAVYDAVIQEVTRDGELVWEWSSADHIDLAESGRWLEQLREPYDLTHINALSELPDGDLVISMRQVDAIYRIDRETGEIVWKLGGTPSERSLRVVDDPNPEVLGGQHDVRWIGDGEITVFDNQTGLDQPPRALRLRIEGDVARVVEIVEDDAQTDSRCCGSARRAEDGSWVIAWGGNSLVTGVGPDGERRFALEFEPGVTTYRAVPAGDHSEIERFRAGMSAQVPDAR